MAGIPQPPAAQEFSGKSVEEATAEGLRRMGLRPEDATVEVVSRGSRGLFGLGSEPAVVRIAPLFASNATGGEGAPAIQLPPEPAAAATPAPEIAATAPAATPAPGDVAPAAAETLAGAENAGEVTDDSAPPRDDQVVEMASEMLSTLVRLMGFRAQVDASWRDADAITDERHLLLSVRGQELSPLIGRRGDTLDNLQYLLRLMVNQKQHRWLNIIVDVEEYRAKRVEHLTHLAERMAEQVATTGRSFALEPMPPNERRIVHLALRDHPSIYTESVGDGERRKVIIYPRK